MTDLGAPTVRGVDPKGAYLISVAAVDASGHESLLAYPEYRCDSEDLPLVCQVSPTARSSMAERAAAPERKGVRSPLLSVFRSHSRPLPPVIVTVY
jgi:hypothetical protein